MMSTLTQTDPRHSKSMPAMIAKLLAERQEVLVLFNRLVQLKGSAAIAAIQSLLQRFCQALVDYVALGHFEVYQCLADNAGETEHCRRIKRLARELYPRIAGTTQAAIDFSDCYAGRGQGLNNLYEDLSQLGERLATRIDLEDRLIKALRSPTAALA